MPSLRELAHVLTAAPRHRWQRDDVRFVLAYLVLPVGLVLGVFAGLRAFYGHCVEPDDADLILFSQRLSWGYSEQPPLYSWLCEIAFAIFGIGPLALTVVKTLNLAAIVGLSFVTARLVVPDRRLALLASYAVLLVPSVSWHALTYLTHSNLLYLSTLATLYAFLRLVRDGRSRDYVFLGIACAAGVLSKYNFIVLAAALLLASLTLAPVRRRLLNVRFALTLGVFALLVAPHAVWLVNNMDGISGLLRAKVLKLRHAEWSAAARVLMGWKELAVNSLLTVGPLAFLVWRLFREATFSDDSFPVLARRILGRCLLAAVGILMLQIAVSRTGYFHERWLMPFVAVVPLWLFARLDATPVPVARIRTFVVLLMVLAFGYTTARVVQIIIGSNNSTAMYPIRLNFRDLADAIKAEVGDRPVVFTPEREIAGNLLLELPNARMRCGCAWLFDRPDRDKPLIVAWNPEICGHHPIVPWPLFTRFADVIPPCEVPPSSIRTVRISSLGPQGRPASVSFVVFK